ncbi:MAG: CRTAC1 family protein [Acidimicrobiia bacterium]|nr:CRTAC1 family protein [Acidimicrobiia bacterium]
MRISILLAVIILIGFVAVRLFGASTTPSPAPLGPPLFEDVTAASGVAHSYEGGFTFFVGGGVAVFDCNADRLPDFFLAGGSSSSALYRNSTGADGAIRFVPLPSLELTGVTGAYPLDVDSDGITDLSILRVGENIMMRGLGNCEFEPANAHWGIDSGDDWTVGFSATWENGNNLPTLAFGNYLALDENGQQFGGCADHRMLRPTGVNGTYADPIVISPGYCSLSMLFSDWNRSNARDLRISNDRHYYRQGEEQLLKVMPGQNPRPYTREEGWQFIQIEGMGIASHDVTGDGMPEIFLTSMADNKLQRLTPGARGPSYGDIAFESGVTAHRPHAGPEILPSTAWHPEFQDVNNDGLIDLFISKGNVDATAGFAMEDPNNLLLGQPDGKFVERADAAGILDFEKSRGAALVDLNLDGKLDLVYVNREAPARVWQNAGDGVGNWLAINLAQDGSNRDAIGSWVEVRIGERIQSRELTIGGGHAGGQLGWMHFGLGFDDGARVRVQWPDGELGDWIPLEANQYATIERESNEVLVWKPAS